MRSMPIIRTALLATVVAIAPAAAVPGFAQPILQLQSFAPLVEAVKPAVVTVVVQGAERSAQRRAVPPEMEEFMERFFRDRPGRPDRPRRPNQGLGSGFVIDAEGIIVTNNHVVAGADEITVVLDDGTEYQAELVGRDTRVDIAVLRIDAGRDLPTVTWGDSDTVRVGDWAVAIGNPLGLNGTVTAGIISARGRDINSGPYDDYLQVDAAINRGNSGGPLFDVNGAVIGVNTAIISPSGGNVGLGFAIPAQQAQQIVADLIEDGTVERGWIGVSIQPVTDDIAQSLGLEGTDGALVAEVMEDSPAEAAGLRAGDVILGFNGAAIEDLRDLTRAVAATEAGSAATIEIWRDNDRRNLDITPGLLEQAAAETGPNPSAPAALDIPELDLTLGTSPGSMLVVTEAGQSAAEQGLRQGDIILSIDQTEVTEPSAAAAAVADALEVENETVLVLIERDGARRFLTLELNRA